jgi:hypothetical protein
MASGTRQRATTVSDDARYASVDSYLHQGTAFVAVKRMDGPGMFDEYHFHHSFSPGYRAPFAELSLGSG